LGRFSTEIDLSLHGTIRERLRYAKLIGPNNDEDSLQRYSNELCEKYIKEQVRYYPNSMNMIQSYPFAATHKRTRTSVCVSGTLLREIP